MSSEAVNFLPSSAETLNAWTFTPMSMRWALLLSFYYTTSRPTNKNAKVLRFEEGSTQKVSQADRITKQGRINAVFEVLKVKAINGSYVSLDTTQCSLLKIELCFGGLCRLHPQDWITNPARNQRESLFPTYFHAALCSTYNPTLKMETICPFETSVNFQLNMRRYIAGDRALQRKGGGEFRCYCRNSRSIVKCV
jgi:hypothetical protein